MAEQSGTKHKYFFYKEDPQRGRVKEYLRPGRGLERFFLQNCIEERRVTVEDLSEVQDLLDEGKSIILYKLRVNWAKAWRFTSSIIMNAENTHVDGDDLVYKGTPKPARENNIFPDQIECVHQFMVVSDPRFDKTPSQKERSKRPAHRQPEVVRKPSAKATHPGYNNDGGSDLSDEEAARRANSLMEQTPPRSGINPHLK